MNKNFTPLKLRNNKKKIMLYLYLFLIIFFIGLIIYYTKEKLLIVKIKSVGIACKTITDKKECEKSCSPPKGPKNIQYQCRWDHKEEKCEESGKECEEDSTQSPRLKFSQECQKVNDKCYNCKATESGPAFHYICDYLAGQCPSTEIQGKVEERFLGNKEKDKSYVFCFDYGLNHCGMEQIDYPKGQYLSRIGPEECEKIQITPTLTPTVIATSTPTPSKRPTSTPSLTPTFKPTNTPFITNTPTITLSITPSDSPTLTPTLTVTISVTPTPTATLSISNTPTTTPINSPTPTEIVIAQITSTPTQEVNSQSSVIATYTPVPPVTADYRTKWIFLIPLILIGLGLLL